MGLEVYQDLWDLKEKLALGVHLVPLVLQDFLEHEERVADREMQGTQDLRESQASRDQGDPLDLQVCLDRKVRWVPRESLVILGRVRLAPQALSARKVIPAPVVSLDYQALQDHPDPLGLQGLHLLT